MTIDSKMDDRTAKNIYPCHPDIKRLVGACYANSPYPFKVTEGMRSAGRQEKLIKEGKSKTRNSRHLTGHAFDIAIFPYGSDVSWDYEKYELVAEHIKSMAKKLDIPIEWGGDWKKWIPGKKDGTHFQLSWQTHPLGNQKPKTIASSKTVISAGTVSLASVAPQVIDVLDKGSEVSEKAGNYDWAIILIITLLCCFIVYERVKKIKVEGL